MSIVIRGESTPDIETIDGLTIAAFFNAEHTSHTEHFIIRGLREADQLVVSLVAESNGRIVGHAAVSPVQIFDGTQDWYGLGPVSVAPDFQGNGIGTKLIQQILIDLQGLGAAGCVVLGEPGYYNRFGFAVQPGLILASVPPAYFQAISFSEKIPQGSVKYHPAFNAKS